MPTVEVESYKASVTKETIDGLGGVVRVWDRPASIVEGAQVVDTIAEPIEVTVVEEEQGMHHWPQRAKVTYGEGKEGWVLYNALRRE